ncbi:hypothetical protein [Tsukamurella spumae]|uniref:Uncharacterized protein n=1 Tax=Tsukamurella spumae TaxID=44753 RepID=A0A846X1Q6_9ACTN|nr:hypothetical protein [Tsukamurella spumae]NKY19527.1 hypothetical protein [Tsukamurella spumae]
MEQIQVDESVAKLGFVRVCEHHCPIGWYEAKLEGFGAKPIETLIRVAERLGKVWGGTGADNYRHELVLLGADGDMGSDAQIPGESWDWWVQAADLRLSLVDDCYGCPTCSIELVTAVR